MTGTWPRTDPRPTGRSADLVLIAFHQGPLRDDVPLDAGRFGIPAGHPEQLLDIQSHQGAEARAWIDGFRAGFLRRQASADLGDLAALEAADAAVTVRATLLDPADLGYLQAAWAVVRWLCARGAGVVLDARAIRYASAAGVSAVAPDAPFDIRRELVLVCEERPSGGLGGHVMHTRGLLKLGRPDLVTVVAGEDLEPARAALWRLAERLALGALPQPGDRVELDQPVPLLLTPAPGGSFTEALHLDNQALLVCGVDGASPVWAAARN